jgi:hypothetical protein
VKSILKSLVSSNQIPDDLSWAVHGNTPLERASEESFRSAIYPLISDLAPIDHRTAREDTNQSMGLSKNRGEIIFSE